MQVGKLLWVAALGVLLASNAQAHSAADIGGGFVSGLLHPVLGWDHVAAMVAVARTVPSHGTRNTINSTDPIVPRIDYHSRAAS